MNSKAKVWIPHTFSNNKYIWIFATDEGDHKVKNKRGGGGRDAEAPEGCLLSLIPLFLVPQLFTVKYLFVVLALDYGQQPIKNRSYLLYTFVNMQHLILLIPLRVWLAIPFHGITFDNILAKISISSSAENTSINPKQRRKLKLSAESWN